MEGMETLVQVIDGVQLIHEMTSVMASMLVLVLKLKLWERICLSRVYR